MPEEAAVQKINVRCCIAGGGPAGMVLAYLLARAGVEVLVLEKHADFLRDFRGDTIHPSTLEVMHELGLLDEFLKLPHDELRDIGVQINDVHATIADFTHLPTHCKFIALMPQWDFLNFLADHAKRYPEFNLRMRAEVTDLILEGDRVIGVRAKSQFGPFDVLSSRISRKPTDPVQTLGPIDSGRVLVQIQRNEYWQCAFVIPKGGFDAICERGLPAFREEIARLSPYLRERVDELKTWDDIKLLTVVVDRLKQWHRPGLLCIGDSAHAMSPIGGVGINLAIQDAVAAGNILAPAFQRGAVPGIVPVMDALTSELSTEGGTLPAAIAMGLTLAPAGLPSRQIASPVLRGRVDQNGGRSGGDVGGRGAGGNRRAASAPELEYSTVTEDDLAAVQRRREFPTRMMQRLQVLIQNRVISALVASKKQLALPWPIKLLARFPILRRIPAYVVGMGFRPEHVQTGDATAAPPEETA